MVSLTLKQVGLILNKWQFTLINNYSNYLFQTALDIDDALRQTYFLMLLETHTTHSSHYAEESDWLPIIQKTNWLVKIYL